MLIDVMEHFGIKLYFRDAEFYETENQKRIFQHIRRVIPEGQLIAVSGVVGSGKTTTINRLQKQLQKEKKVMVAKSLSVEKSRTNLGTLITALFYDVSGDKEYKVPKQGEKRERDLRDLIKNTKKPVVLFVDEAHDLHHRTLTGLKRLMEVVRDGGGILSIVLAGHPKLKNDLNSPNMEEIGYRTITLSLDSLQGNLRDYIRHVVSNCAMEGVKVADIIDDEAIEYLAEKLSTPLQIEQHLSKGLVEAFTAGIKPVNKETLEVTLSSHINDPEPTLIRHGYTDKVLNEQFHYKPAEIRKFLRGELDSNRAQEMVADFREAGLPI